jgi:SAM-dependent methyltransferase
MKKIKNSLILSYLEPNALILDFGCGAGRDTKYFLEKNFKVEALDGSQEMCKIASSYCNIEVKNILFEDFKELNKYDGIWACSSILHVPYYNLSDIFLSINKALKRKGILYVSFKYGDFEGYRGERYFTNLTLKRFLDIPNITSLFSIEEHFITKDVRTNRENEKWLNIIMRRK